MNYTTFAPYNIITNNVGCHSSTGHWNLVCIMQPLSKFLGPSSEHWMRLR
ncbi:hypothetical protein [Wolbachia endosymbiont (group A) of Agelastica alni]